MDRVECRKKYGTYFEVGFGASTIARPFVKNWPFSSNACALASNGVCKRAATAAYLRKNANACNERVILK